METTTIPTPTRRAAVYRLYDAAGTLLYIGSSYDPERRCKAHRAHAWWPAVARRTEEWHDSRGAAYYAEMAAIAAEGAKYNQMGTPTYRTPNTEATRRRDEASRARGRVDSESWRIQKETAAHLRAAGVSWEDAQRAAEEARFVHLEQSGLFTAFLERHRATLTERSRYEIAITLKWQQSRASAEDGSDG